MPFDVDAFEERAAIMEYDGGLSRFRAETMAAGAQGVARHEAIRERDTAQARHKRAAMDRRPREGNLPGVQPHAQKEAGRVPERVKDAGRDPGILPSLRLGDGGES